MRKFVASFILLLVLSSSAFSQVSIKKEHRIANRDPGYCAWACIETLARHNNIKSLHDLLDNRSKEFTWEWDGYKWVKSSHVWVNYGYYQVREPKNVGTHEAIAGKLNSFNVKYRHQNYHNYNTSLIKEAINNKNGCMVVVRWWKESTTYDYHAIILLDYNKDGIKFFDPNDIEYSYTATHHWFNYYWTGYVLVLD